MVQQQYLSPIEDEDDIKLYKHTEKDGAQYIEAKGRLDILTLISEVRLPQNFVDRIIDLLELAAQRTAQDLQEERQDELQQMEM